MCDVGIYTQIFPISNARILSRNINLFEPIFFSDDLFFFYIRCVLKIGSYYCGPELTQRCKYRPCMTRRTDAICVVSYFYSSHVCRNPVKNLYLPLSCKSLKACKFNNTHSYAQNKREKWHLWTQRQCLLFLLLSQPRKWQFANWIQRCRMWEAYGHYRLSMNGRSTLTDISNVRQTLFRK